jgi:hypothetical protein
MDDPMYSHSLVFLNRKKKSMYYLHFLDSTADCHKFSATPPISNQSSFAPPPTRRVAPSTRASSYSQAPPPPAPPARSKPHQDEELVEALYDYEGTSQEDLSFKEHQIIKVTEHSLVISCLSHRQEKCSCLSKPLTLIVTYLIFQPIKTNKFGSNLASIAFPVVISAFWLATENNLRSPVSDDWWNGQINNGPIGMFPSSYVKPI